jgi:hypothetical protein
MFCLKWLHISKRLCSGQTQSLSEDIFTLSHFIPFCVSLKTNQANEQGIVDKLPLPSHKKSCFDLPLASAHVPVMSEVKSILRFIQTVARKATLQSK